MECWICFPPYFLAESPNYAKISTHTPRSDHSFSAGFRHFLPAAAGIGSAIYDMLNPLYISEAWITFLTKGAYGLAAGLVILCSKKPWGYVRATLATLTGALVYAALYLGKTFFYSGMLLKGLSAEAAALTVVTKLPATTFNAVVAILAAPALAIAIRQSLEQNHLSLD